jgi:DNA-binding GntR family transcriptional regulator
MLIVSMEAGERMSLYQIRAFVEGAVGLRFEGRLRSEVYERVTRTLREQGQAQQSRASKGLMPMRVE